jgi:hypothetical protein
MSERESAATDAYFAAFHRAIRALADLQGQVSNPADARALRAAVERAMTKRTATQGESDV